MGETPAMARKAPGRRSRQTATRRPVHPARAPSPQPKLATPELGAKPARTVSPRRGRGEGPGWGPGLTSGATVWEVRRGRRRDIPRAGRGQQRRALVHPISCHDYCSSAGRSEASRQGKSPSPSARSAGTHPPTMCVSHGGGERGKGEGPAEEEMGGARAGESRPWRFPRESMDRGRAAEEVLPAQDNRQKS